LTAALTGRPGLATVSAGYPARRPDAGQRSPIAGLDLGGRSTLSRVRSDP